VAERKPRAKGEQDGTSGGLQNLEQCHTNFSAWNNATQTSAPGKMPHKLQRLEQCHKNFSAWNNATQTSAPETMPHKLQRLEQCQNGRAHV
jgi:hypothetical protein